MSALGGKAFRVAVVLILAVVFLITPFAMRSLQGNDALIGQESYVHLAVAQNLLEPDSYPFPDITPTLYDWIIALLIIAVKPLLLSKLLPMALGAIAVLLFFLNARSISEDLDEQSLGGLFLIISPLFLSLFTSLTPFSLVLVLGMLSWWLYRRQRVLSLGVLLLIIFIDAKGFVVAAILMVAYGLREEDWKPAAIAGAAGLFLIIFLDAVFGFLASDLLVRRGMGSVFVTLGADFGYSFFIVFLAIMGAVAYWSREGKHVAASLLLLGVFVFSFSDVASRVLLMPVAALLAARGTLLLVRRTWSVQSIRGFTLFLAGLSLLFTFVLAISTLAEEQPTLESIEGFHFLQTMPEGEVVLSSPENGVFIRRIGRRPAFLDDLQREEENRNAEIAEQIFFSQRMSLTGDLLRSQNITHILIDQEMRDGGVWTADDQGLLFLLENDKQFIKVYDKGGMSIYRFVGGNRR